MKNKTKNQGYYSQVSHRVYTYMRRGFLNTSKKFISLVSIFALLLLFSGIYLIHNSQEARAAGIDDVTVTLTTETVNTASDVTVVFTFGTLSNGDTIDYYLGEDTSGDEWQDNSITTADVSCSDDGTGETYTVNTVSAATASLPLRVTVTATTVGSGATQVTCVIGDGAPDPINPISADGYSVAVVTSNDSGAGLVYVGDANDVTVTVDVLPNLSLTIDNADGTNCTTTSGVTSCSLGTVLTTTVVTGNYDVNVGSNASSGVTLQVLDDGNLRNGANDIDDVVEDNTVTAGTEGNGVAITADASWTESAPFDDDDTPTTTSNQTVATTSGAISKSGDDVTVTHRAAIDSTTLALTYTHIMTWTATANF